MTDKTITCKDCNHEFIFNESEQAFYKEKGFENEPQRCPDCRAAKKRKWEIGAVAAMVVEEIEAVTEILAVAVIGGKLQESKYSPV